MNKTSIAWVRNPDGTPGFTWNPVKGCTPISPGCAHCYASRLASTRLAHLPEYKGLAHDGKWTGEVRFFPERLAEPLRHRKPAGIFLNDMGDTYHESVTFEQIAAMYGVMAACPQHTFYVLTKRAKQRREWFGWLDTMAERCRSVFPYENHEWLRMHVLRAKVVRDAAARKMPSYTEMVAGGWPLPNVIEMSTVCTQAETDRDIPELLQTPAARRGLSIEPMLEEIDIAHSGALGCNCEGEQCSGGCAWYKACGKEGLSHRTDLVIIGGESGPHARPFQVDWARSIRDQCKAAGVAYFLKQLGANCQTRNDDNFTCGDGDIDFPGWPDHLAAEDRIEEIPQGMEYQGAPVRLHFRDRAGADPAEWRDDLRVREFPKETTP